MAWMVQEVFREQAALTSEWLQFLAIVVAIGTGVAMSVGFGPAAGAAGLGSGLNTTAGAAAASYATGSYAGDLAANAAVSFIASGATTLLQQSFAEMTRDQRDQGRIDTRFWENNPGVVRRLVGRSLVAGAFNAGTSFIPGGSFNGRNPAVGPNATMREATLQISNRLCNNMAGVAQSVAQDAAGGTDPNWDSIRDGLVNDAVMRSF
jgi:hypothetical protein